MNNFYISVSNGLLTADHRERIGTALWEFMWCLDKITKIEKDIGYVLGGKPINLSDIGDQMGVVDMTVSRNLQKLEEEGYIKKRVTPYGIVIMVLKAKKRFNKNVEPPKKNVEPPNGNVEPNKTVSVDITDDTSGPTAKEIVSYMECFKDVNPSWERLIANKTERASSSRFIKKNGFEKACNTAKALKDYIYQPYAPKITSPYQLERDLGKLLAFVKQCDNKSLPKSKVAFT